MTRAQELSKLINTSSFSVDSDFNVGIGSTSPDVKLDIGGAVLVTGISTFENTAESTSSTTGALIVSGGVGISGNLSVAGIATFGTGTVTVDGDSDLIYVGVGVTLSGQDGIWTKRLTVDGDFVAKNLTITGIATLASEGGITTTGGDLYVGKNLRVAGVSTFIGNATFRGGTIGIGDSTGDDINVSGEFISDLNPNEDGLYDLGIVGKRWRDARFSGLVTSTTLNVANTALISGISTFQQDVDVIGTLVVLTNLFNNFEAFGPELITPPPVYRIGLFDLWINSITLPTAL